ncbi:DsbA family protein [Natronohydrobacter thiooxidans]|uniref:DsbA family protein n=1 Tax=Natronohydrobacter thiooxidans TaxID=87172 RepID=UPI000AB16FD0
MAREWPILGEGSVFAARVALAAREQARYEEFHFALMGMDEGAEEASVLQIAAEIGINTDQLRRDMAAPEIEAHIATSMRLTQALSFGGTPSFVIGDVLVPGLVDADQLQELVAQARNVQK